MPEITTVIEQIKSSSAAQTHIRNHLLTSDRPEAKGGANAGPMGGELLVASLGACFMSNLIAAFNGRDQEIEGLAVRVTGSLEGTPPRFVKMEMGVEGKDIDRERMEKMVTIAERGCIVANTLKQAMAVQVRVV